MQNAISPNFPMNSQSAKFTIALKPGLFSSIISWCNNQEENKFLWLAIAQLGHIGVILPLTLVAVLNAGNNIVLWMIACTVNVPVLTLNLAAQSTKITLPALFFAWFVNAVIIAYCVAIFFK